MSKKRSPLSLLHDIAGMGSGAPAPTNVSRQPAGRPRNLLGSFTYDQETQDEIDDLEHQIDDLRGELQYADPGEREDYREEIAELRSQLKWTKEQAKEKARAARAARPKKPRRK